MIWEAISEHLSAATGESHRLTARNPVSGGCIHEAVRVSSDRGHTFFIKLNEKSQLPVLEAEAEGLEALRKANALRVPRFFCHGASAGKAYLVLEFIDMRRDGDEAARGRQLAALHRTTAARFGWTSDNFIGQTPQPNGWSECWWTFFREKRLRYQADLAARKGLRLKHLDVLLEELPAFVDGHSPVPSLLHGDLWGGNAAFDARGAPVLFDPAVYYGDRETDLAFSEFFGGFGAGFYRAYDEAWAIPAGYRERKRLYNLYHELNHFNIFGGHYGAQAQSTVEALVAKLR